MNYRIMQVAVALFAIACVTVTLWVMGRALDHMTDPCRTADQRAMTPACK